MHCGHFPPHLLLSRFNSATIHRQMSLNSLFTHKACWLNVPLLLFLLRSARGPGGRTSLLPGMIHFLLPCFFVALLYNREHMFMCVSVQGELLNSNLKPPELLQWSNFYIHTRYVQNSGALRKEGQCVPHSAACNTSDMLQINKKAT